MKTRILQIKDNGVFVATKAEKYDQKLNLALKSIHKPG